MHAFQGDEQHRRHESEGIFNYAHQLSTKGDMHVGFSMSLWIGIISAICGLALPVLVGIVLYRYPKKQARPIEKSSSFGETVETA